MKVGNDWFRKRQENLLTPSRTKRLDEETIDEEKKNALDLLDAISRSGSLSLATSELHVIIGVTHSLDESAISFFFLTLSRRWCSHKYNTCAFFVAKRGSNVCPDFGTNWISDVCTNFSLWLTFAPTSAPTSGPTKAPHHVEYYFPSSLQSISATAVPIEGPTLSPSDEPSDEPRKCPRHRW